MKRIEQAGSERRLAATTLAVTRKDILQLVRKSPNIVFLQV